MALLTAITPTAAGAAYSLSAVSSSDTISQAALGSRGAYLIVTNGGGSSDTVTVSDGSFSPSGNAGTPLTNAVANGTSEVMFIPASTVNSATGLTTITHSFTTSVTCALLTVG